MPSGQSRPHSDRCPRALQVNKAGDAKQAVAAALAFLREDEGGQQMRADLNIQVQGSDSPQDRATLKRAMEQVCF